MLAFSTTQCWEWKLRWVLSVPSWFCWVCQEYKDLNCSLNWDFCFICPEDKRDEIPPPQGAGILLLTTKAGNLPNSGVHLCITTLCTCKHPHLPSLPPGTLLHMQHWCNLMLCLAASVKALCLTQESSVRICSNCSKLFQGICK